MDGSYFKDKFFRLKARRGYLRAAVVIAHKSLKAVYVMLSPDADYPELGAAYLDATDTDVSLAISFDALSDWGTTSRAAPTFRSRP